MFSAPTDLEGDMQCTVLCLFLFIIENQDIGLDIRVRMRRCFAWMTYSLSQVYFKASQLEPFESLCYGYVTSVPYRLV